MLPINISLTGHRDIDSGKASEYKEKIRQVLIDILDKYPKTKINLLCGMAEGADIIGANAAVSLREEYRISETESRVGLIAVLPMAKDDYINTFSQVSKEKSINDFEQALASADKIYDLSKIYSDFAPAENPYVKLGTYLVDNSQAIIALWNGTINHKKGGTASVVEYALNGAPGEYKDSYNIMDANDTIPVYHILVQRTSKKEKGQSVGYIKKQTEWGSILYPKVWEYMNGNKRDVENYYNNFFMEFNAYNQNVEKYKVNTEQYLLNDKSSVSIEQTKKTEGMQEIIDYQASFSSLAQIYQKKTWFYSGLQLFLGWISFLWVAFYDSILSNCKWLSGDTASLILLLVPFSVFICVLVYRMVSKKRIESRYYDYRAMSENLRVQFYWKLSGLKNNTYNHYSRKNEWELGWVLAAVKNISMNINYSQCICLGERNYKDLKACWIDNQITYFNKKCRENNKVVNISSMFKYFLFGLGVLASVLLFFQVRWQIIGIQQFVLLFSVDFFLSCGAVFHNYVEQRQFETEYKQYKRMIMFLVQAKAKFEKAYLVKDYTTLDKILIEVGYDALAENADWVIYNRMSSIDIPMG